jgi:hypothetical protein
MLFLHVPLWPKDSEIVAAKETCKRFLCVPLDSGTNKVASGTAEH